MSKNKQLKRVRDLLSKTVENGATIAEAESAISMATKLMRKYSIENDEVDLSGSDFDCTDILVFRRRYENSKWEWRMLQVLAEHNLCKVIGTKLGGAKAPQGILLHLYGTKENRDIVEHLFLTMRTFLRDLYPQKYKDWKEHQIEKFSRRLGEEFVRDNWMSLEREKVIPRRSKWVSSYLIGATVGVDNRLRREAVVEETTENKQKYGLIKVKHSDLIEAHIKKVMPDVITKNAAKTRIVGDAFVLGKIDGGIDTSIKAIG